MSGLDAYDAGLLNDWGGGNVEWWQDYIRAELGRAHDFYVAQHAAEVEQARREGAEACGDIVQGWLDHFSDFQPEHITAQKWAVDAMLDILAAIRARGKRAPFADLTSDEKRFGVILSTDHKGKEVRVSVKQWSRFDGEPPHLTFAIYVGDHRWVEAEMKPEDALKVVQLALLKPAIRARGGSDAG